MKITLSEMDSAHKILITLIDKKLPIKLSYKVMKLTKIFESELEFYNSQFKSLIEDCALKDENGELVYTEDKTNIKLIEGKVDEFNTRYNDLVNLEIEIDDYTFTLDELEVLELTPKELFTLERFIVEEEKTEN